MTGKTHIACGMAAALAVTRPGDLQELSLCVVASAVGAVICDVDAKASDARKQFNRAAAVVMAIMAAVVYFDYRMGINGFAVLFYRESMIRSACGILLFLTVCARGRTTPHRSFMHSMVASLILSATVYIIMPQMVLPFWVAVMSHILLDILNNKKVRVFYPLKDGICLNICKADKMADKVLFYTGIMWMVFLISYVVLG